MSSNRQARLCARHTPIRFVGRRGSHARVCGLFYGLPTPSMQAWIAAGTLLDAPQAIDNCNEIPPAQ